MSQPNNKEVFEYLSKLTDEERKDLFEAFSSELTDEDFSEIKEICESEEKELRELESTITQEDEIELLAETLKAYKDNNLTIKRVKDALKTNVLLRKINNNIIS